ncbi:MAG: MerR family transcriptional regulator [Anaerolineales bacterium]|nr:MerR family transcriptional regulator [Anaerolineales bacterium]
MPEKYLRTSDIAREIGCHPNTVRLYEEWGHIPKVERSRSNYRLFTKTHLEHMRLAWTALSGSYPGKTLKRSAYAVVRQAASGDLGGALEMAYSHLALVKAERAQAEAAAELLERWSQGTTTDATSGSLQIGEAARLLKVSRDMLRNWEQNGLISVPRASNGYRKYGAPEIGRLRVIRMLVRSGYSMMAILRMLLQLDQGEVVDVRQALDTPREDEDIFTAADQWLSTLATQAEKGSAMIIRLEAMIDTLAA